jgi:hypothetical protein
MSAEEGHWMLLGPGLRESFLYPYRWRVRARLPDRFGQRCRVVVRGSMNSALVEFERDGFRVVTSRNYMRRS